MPTAIEKYNSQEYKLDFQTLEARPEALDACMGILSKPYSRPVDLGPWIESDPVLAGQVLVEANRSDFRAQASLLSISEAMAQLGRRRVEDLFFGNFTRRYFPRQKCEGMELFWALSQNLANACRAEALSDFPDNSHAAEEAYAFGLIADLGKLCFSRDCSGASWVTMSCDEERALWGLDHAELGARLAAQWGLPEPLCEAIRQHHGEGANTWIGGLLQHAVLSLAKRPS